MITPSFVKSQKCFYCHEEMEKLKVMIKDPTKLKCQKCQKKENSAKSRAYMRINKHKYRK